MNTSILDTQTCPICQDKAEVQGPDPLEQRYLVKCTTCFPEKPYLIVDQVLSLAFLEDIQALPERFRQLQLEELEIPAAYWDNEHNGIAVRPYNAYTQPLSR